MKRVAPERRRRSLAAVYLTESESAWLDRQAEERRRTRSDVLRDLVLDRIEAEQGAASR